MSDLSDINDRLSAAADKAEAGSQVIHDFANGDEDTKVDTESGQIPTLSGLVKSYLDALNQGSSIDPEPGKIPRADSSGLIDAGWVGDSIYDYPALRAYSGKAKRVFITKDGIAGQFKNIGVVLGSVDNGGTKIVATNGMVWVRVFSGPISVHWFDCPLDGTTNCDEAFSKWSSVLKIGSGEIPRGKYSLTTLKFSTVGHAPVEGGLQIEATGASFIGACTLVLDSCKRVNIFGLEGFQMDIHINGGWFCNFHDVKFRYLICGSAAGTIFSDNYWNNFWGGQFQGAKSHANSQGPSNKFSFYGTVLRGSPSQSFTDTVAWAFDFQANQNIQGWTYYGGDISYHSEGIIRASESNVSDIEITFHGIYWDTKYPDLKSRPKTRIISKSSHVANDMPYQASMATLARGESDAFRSDRAAGWKSWTALNLVPNGDFQDVIPSYVGAGLPIGSSNSAVVTPKYDGGPYGNYLNINQALTSSNNIRIRPKALPFATRASAQLVLRNADPGSKTLRVTFAGLSFNAIISSSEWTYVNITSGLDISAGTVSDIQVYTNDPETPTGFNIDIGYAGVFAGEQPPALLPSMRHRKHFGSISWNPPAVASGAQSASIRVTVPGAALGDFVSCSLSIPLQGTQLIGSVSAVDTVEVFLRNGTAESVDLGAGTLRVKVDKSSY